MIETEPTTAPDKPTVDTVVTAAMHRTLRLLARVSRRQGSSYDGPSFMIARELFGSDLVNVKSWTDVYGGYPWGAEHSFRSLSYYGDRGYAAPVSEATLRDEYLAAVSRETVTTPPDALTALLQAVPEPAIPRDCTCVRCTDEGCPGADHDEGCDQCDDHGCASCYGDGYSCDDHSCSACRPDCYTQSCCGYCAECGSHPDGPDDSDTCSNCGYCHDCGHVCDDVD